MLRVTKQVDKDELLERYLTAMTGSFDPHSSYMSPRTVEEFDIAMRLQLQGMLRTHPTQYLRAVAKIA